jgi:hypothetical protein
MTPGNVFGRPKSCKGGTRVPDAIIGKNQPREITPTENPRSSKVAGVQHKASNQIVKIGMLKNLSKGMKG